MTTRAKAKPAAPVAARLPIGHPASVEQTATIHPEALIRYAARALAGRCDGARLLDGMGFNKNDAGVIHPLLEAPTWTLGQQWNVYRRLLKYRGQLASMGIDTANPEHLRAPAKINIGRIQVEFQAASDGSGFMALAHTKYHTYEAGGKTRGEAVDRLKKTLSDRGYTGVLVVPHEKGGLDK